jgi:hypothetical protein
MTKSFRQQHTLSLREAPVLAFDVDWSRGRVVAIVDGSDEIAQASVVGGRLQTMEGFGERHAEPVTAQRSRDDLKACARPPSRAMRRKIEDERDARACLKSSDGSAASA